MATSLVALRGQCDSWEHHAIITLCNSALDNQEGFLFHTWMSLHWLTNSLKHFESVTNFLKTASAIGDPQMLPKYSNSTLTWVCVGPSSRANTVVSTDHMGTFLVQRMCTESVQACTPHHLTLAPLRASVGPWACAVRLQIQSRWRVPWRAREKSRGSQQSGGGFSAFHHWV